MGQIKYICMSACLSVCLSLYKRVARDEIVILIILRSRRIANVGIWLSHLQIWYMDLKLLSKI